MITVAISTLVPLLVLAAGFEAIFALHMNVERIGRYLQVFHEQDGGWEHVAMRFGQRFPGAGPDPLFAQLFVFGDVGQLPSCRPGSSEPIEVGVIAVLHLVLVYRHPHGARSGRAAAQRGSAAVRAAASETRESPDTDESEFNLWCG